MDQKVHETNGDFFFEIAIISVKVSWATYAMSSSSGTFFITTHFCRASDGHLCTHETCVLQTSLKVGNFGRRFLGHSQFKVINNFVFRFYLNCMLMVSGDGL